MKEYFHKLAAGYKFLFLKACTFVLLLGVCLLFSFCIVYPLWLLATRYTQAYTAISLLLFLALLLFFIVKRSIKSYKAHPRRFLHSLIKKLILFGVDPLLYIYFCLSSYLGLGSTYSLARIIWFRSLWVFGRPDIALSVMKKFPLCCALILFIHIIAAAEYAELPLIPELSPQNHIFQQYSDDVLYARKALAAGKTARELPLQFYRYKAQKEDTVIRIAARCSIPYDALITLNGIESVKTNISGKMLLLPTLPALYLPKKRFRISKN